MSQIGVIVLAHGSRGERDPGKRLDEIIQRLQIRLDPTVELMQASLQFRKPELTEAADVLIARGVRRIVVVPYFLFEGRHLNEDIPEKLETIKQRHLGIQISVAGTLGVDDRLIDLLQDRIGEALASSSATSFAERPNLAPQAIEAESMRIIEQLLPPLSCSREERDIIKRIIHATGDAQLARQIRIHPGAVSAGLEVIREKRSIFTDVKMVAAGISRRAKTQGCEVVCLMDDPEVAALAHKQGATRAATGIRYFGDKLNGAIIAIGNAPTALFALLDGMDEHGARPALIVGVPVGFVGAAQSKAELAKRDTPYILTEGFRGGSGVAAAAVNALLKLAEEKT